MDTAADGPAHWGTVGPMVLFMSLAAALVTVVLSRDKWVQHRWHTAAKRLGMRFQPGNLLEGDRIRGRYGRYRVDLSNLNRKHTSVVLHAPHLPTNIYCSARTWDYLGRDDTLTIGDPDFDRVVRVSGPADELQARLGPAARSVLAATIGAPPRSSATIVVTGGRVTYDVEYHVESAARLEHVIRKLASVADALSLDQPVPEQLRAQATATYELPSVRLRCLQALVEHHPGAPQTTEACRALLRHDDPWLRLVAAGHRLDHADGLEVLRTLLEDQQLPDDLRILALQAAERRVGAPRPQAIIATRTARYPLDDLLEDIVTDPSPAVRCAVANALASRDPADPGLLLVLAEDPDDAVATAALHGLARVFPARPAAAQTTQPPPAAGPALADRAPACELGASLVRALHRPGYNVRLAAVDALSVVGTLEAVAPLQAVLRASFFDQRLRQAARGAIRAIQVRAGNGDGGRLSLATVDASRGRLSESERGAVSEVPRSTTG